MQKRHTDRTLYFEELATTSEKYLIPFIEEYYPIKAGMKVLEIGCGDGGNLMPFARRGCRITGVDIDNTRIEEATAFLRERGCPARLLASDILKEDRLDTDYDLILIHDVIEHIYDKKKFIGRIAHFLKPGGVVYIGFPAWQMPFGGHQQICSSKLASHMPFMHLLPRRAYGLALRAMGEGKNTVIGMQDIKSCGISIEQFRKLMKQFGFSIQKERLFFINPHYETKFGLRPRVLSPLIAALPFIRNFFSTSCFFLITKD